MANEPGQPESTARTTETAAVGESPLELSGDRMCRMVEAAMERLVEYIESLPEQPSYDAEGSAELARSLIEPLPEEGEPYEDLLATIFDQVAYKGFNTTSPGYLAYIPGGGLFHAAVADLIADTVNKYTSIWQPAPGFAQIETTVARWLCDIVGYPKGSLGLLTTGGSMAFLSALVTARHARFPEQAPRDFRSGTLYVSDQVHHSVQKAAMLTGFPVRNVREIPTDDHFRMRLDLLERKIAGDREAGLTPFFVVGSAGTVNTGAVDDLTGLADLAAREGLWFHVDGAYGGFFMLTERGRAALRGIERSDSVVLDPHKGMFLPYGTGALVVRDAEALRAAHTVGAGYLPIMQDDPDFVDFAEISPELSRDHRGLRVWLPVKMHGIGAFRRALDEKLDLARWAADELRRIDGIEIVAEPELSLVAFRVVFPGLDRDELNALNRRFCQGVNDRKRVYLSGTVIDGDFIQRICVLSFRTHLDRMQAGLEDILATVEELRRR